MKTAILEGTFMKVDITKGARKFGYLIWTSKINDDFERLFQGKNKIMVRLNGFDLGEKNIDRKYHRISLGYKFTRALSKKHTAFSITLKNDILEVTTL